MVFYSEKKFVHQYETNLQKPERLCLYGVLKRWDIISCKGLWASSDITVHTSALVLTDIETVTLWIIKIRVVHESTAWCWHSVEIHTFNFVLLKLFQRGKIMVGVILLRNVSPWTLPKMQTRFSAVTSNRWYPRSTKSKGNGGRPHDIRASDLL